MCPLVSCDYKWEQKMQRYKTKSVLTKLLISLILPAYVFALEGVPVATDGGLQVNTPKAPYWFNISGVAKLDSTSFTGNTRTTASGVGGLGTYLSAVFIRDIGLSFTGGIGQNYSYTVELNFDADTKQVGIDYAYLTYYGFDCLLPNLSFSLGQVVPGFCLNCATSSKWTTFRERSMGTNTFGPQAGLGINSNTYDQHYSATFAVTQQPKAGSFTRNVYGQIINTHDLWQASTRLTWAPINELGRVFQLGLSAHIQEYANNGLRFIAIPEWRSRSSISLLNTTTYYTNSFGPSGTAPNNNQLWISATNQKTVDLEFTGVYGPWSAEAEYQRAYIARGKVDNASQGPNLQFYGYNVQAAYILTGETRPLKISNGTLGQIKPKSKCGAWEVGARYSFITLDNHDINGGKANNTTVAINWYPNNNVKFMAEYVLSKQRRQFPTYLDHRTVGAFGLRAQFVF